MLIVANSPVGSGKTALMLALSRALRDEYSIAAVTNDIFTRWDSFIYVFNNPDLTNIQRRRRIPHPQQSPPPEPHPRHRNRRLPARCRPRRHQRQPPRAAIPAQAIPNRPPPDRVRRRQPSRQLLARTGRLHHLRDRCGWRGQGASQGRAGYHRVGSVGREQDRSGADCGCGFGGYGARCGEDERGGPHCFCGGQEWGGIAAYR